MTEAVIIRTNTSLGHKNLYVGGVYTRHLHTLHWYYLRGGKREREIYVAFGKCYCDYVQRV